MSRAKRGVLLLISVVLAVAVWGAVHYRTRILDRFRRADPKLASAAATTNVYSWDEAVAKVKAERNETPGGDSALEVPAELKHYTDRHWFLATQIAEISKYNIHTCQDFADLADMIQRGEVVAVPAVTDSYVLMGVGDKADDGEFTQSDTRYESIQTVAKSFAGRSYNLDDPSDRQALKVNMLRSARPETLKILEELATAYHQQFDRPLPVSSLIRPEEYQRALRRVNRNAVLIDTPPHSTGLAFDIDYRYMGIAEQNFLMAELARMKNAGRIEAIRERSANYHVFVFMNGVRPSDDLITASLEDAVESGQETHHASSPPAKARKQPNKARKHPLKASRKSRRPTRKTRR